MPSHLRVQSSFEPVEAHAIYQTSPSLKQRKRKMSLTATYSVASQARSKLGREASRADHDLRLLVGHANLLDSLMIELQEAEREQEAWFNQSIRKASKPNEPRRVQWVDSIPEMDEEDSDDEFDVGSDVDEDEEMFNIPLRKIKSPPVTISSSAIEDDEMDAEYDEDSDEEGLALTRSPSKHSPPELTLDDDEDSESEDECPSPENIALELSEKERAAITTTAFYDIKSEQGLEDYVAAQPQTAIIAAAC